MVLEGEPTFDQKPHFEVSIAHYFILGAALFSIFWGVINAVLVRGVKMDDTTYIQKVLNDDGDAENQPLNGETGEKQSSADILKQMNFIGTKITEGAISFLSQEYLYLGIFSAAFAVLLGLTVDW